MKDLDFDELDKAVNSLMSGAKKDNTAVPADDNAPEHNAPSLDEPGIPITAAPIVPGATKPKSAAATNPDAQPAITPQPTQSSSSRPSAPANRRSGRFMDVVPKKPNTPSAPSRPISRQGATIAPRPDTENMGATTTEMPNTSSDSLPTTFPETSPKPQVMEKSAPSSDWPDPIEMASPPKTAVTPDESQVTSESHDQKDSKEQIKDQPLTSPFLPDAKVEKRPLGSVAPLIPDTEGQTKPKVDQPDDTAAQLPAQPESISTEVPAEFGGDVMKVEADTHMGVPKTDDHDQPMVNARPEDESSSALDKLAPTSEDKQDIPAVKPLQSKVTDKADDLAASEPSASGRISIPQQYKEQPPTGEKESGAIYDTSTYHQPLAHPAKKKSGWLWVLWIVLILLIGAGAGAGLYFLGVM